MTPTVEDVRAAAARIAGHAHRTPVLRSSRIDAEVGAQVLFKCENLQRVGAFKFRGALNALSRFTPEQRRAGVVAYSSGNHAQAVALAARILSVPATIVMPHDAPAAKVAATLGYGAEVVRYDRFTEDREAIGAALAEARGLTLVPPYDHPDVLAGQGTAALELFTDVGALDALFVPLGGGGLLAGSLLAAEALAPSCRVYGVEPAAGDDGRRSLAAGEIVRIDVPATIADGAQTTHLGAHTFPIIQRAVAEIRTASDAELVAAMRVFAATMKLVVEPTGCLGLAAVLRRGGPRRAARRRARERRQRRPRPLRGVAERYNYLVSDANDNMEAGTITITGHDGDEIEAYLARPTGGAPARRRGGDPPPARLRRGHQGDRAPVRGRRVRGALPEPVLAPGARREPGRRRGVRARAGRDPRRAARRRRRGRRARTCAGCPAPPARSA